MPASYREWRELLARVPDDALIEAAATPTVNTVLARAIKHELRNRDLL